MQEGMTNDQLNTMLETIAKLIEAQARTPQEAAQIVRDAKTKFDVLMAELKPGDEFVVTKMDRFARNAPEGIQTVRDLVDKGIAVHILNMGRADNTPTGKLLVTILLAFAEFERDMIVERTMAGKSYAKEHNPEFKEGRPRKDVVYELAEGESISAACRRLGISRTQWYRIMKKAG